MSRAIRLLGLWGPVAALMAVIFFFSSAPVPSGAASIPDWSLHVAAYGALSLLMARALAGGLRPLATARLAMAAALAFAYGLSDEWHQSFVPSRHVEAGDLLMDFVGGILGALAFRVLVAIILAQPDGVS